MLIKALGLSIGLYLSTCAIAQAFENFIPLGTGYSTDTAALPETNSDADAVAVQSDIFETEIYMKEREARVQDSYLNRFISSTETSGGDFDIDY